MICYDIGPHKKGDINTPSLYTNDISNMVDIISVDIVQTKPTQPFFLYHFSDCIFHLKDFADVLVSQPFSVHHPKDGP